MPTTMPLGENGSDQDIMALPLLDARWWLLMSLDVLLFCSWTSSSIP